METQITVFYSYISWLYLTLQYFLEFVFIPRFTKTKIKTANTELINMNLKQNKPKNTRIQKGQKNRRKRDYLQDLYGTPELTTTEYNQKLQRY